jgi:hypothetical protein
VTPAQAGAPLDAGTMAALRDAVGALSPAELSEPERVAELALVTTIPDAAVTFPTVRETAIRAELAARGIRPATTATTAPRPGRAHAAWSIIALLLALVAPALIMTGRTGGAALDPASGTLPSGIGMILALVILAVLEPGRTRGTLYRGGSVGGGTFAFFAVLWLAAAAIVVAGGVGGVGGEPAAVVGLVLQLVAVAGAIVLAVVAIRHDRARPQVLGGRAAPSALDVPRELADSPGFRSGVERRLADWRRHTDTVLTVEERARVRAAEAEVARLVAEKAPARGGAPAA